MTKKILFLAIILIIGASLFVGAQFSLADEATSTPDTATSTPSITVLSPNGGETFLTGAQMNIEWSTSLSPHGSGINIKLISSFTNALFRVIASDIPNSPGFYYWAIPADLANGKYKVQIEVPGTTSLDSSDSYFTITAVTSTQPPAQITSISPTAGPIGTTVTIYGQNLKDDCAAKASLKCQVHIDFGNGSVYWTTDISNRVSWDSGKIVVKVPNGATTGRVHVYRNEIFNWGEANAYNETIDIYGPVFTVTAQPSKTCDELKSGQANYFNQCSSQGFDNVCFNGENGIFQGCVRNSYNDCTVHNVNALQNLLCPVPSPGLSLSASLLSSSDDRAGLWQNFGPGVGNINKNSADWNWTVTLVLPSQRMISRMTIIHNRRGEVWSTGYNRHLKDGTDLYGYEEHPYPLVVITEKQNQLNTAYDQSLGDYGAGTYSFKLYGQRESSQFTGGKLVVEFSDGTNVAAPILVVIYAPTTTTPVVESITVQEQVAVQEQVKCVFKGSTVEQKCYTATNSNSPHYNQGCSGVETCVVDLKGSRGGKLVWKSSCGGYAYTVMGGAIEYAIFDCTATSASRSSGTSAQAVPATSAPLSGAQQIVDINEKSKLLAYGGLDYILAELNQLRNIIKEQQTEIKYLKSLVKDVQALSEKAQDAINSFITYGVDTNTEKLGAGERAAVMNSYKVAFGKLPESEAELTDAIKIANGRFPSVISDKAETSAKTQFVKIYKRAPDMNNANDSAAIKVMAYGLRQKAENRNLNSEKAGIKIFKGIFGKTPQTTQDWNTMQAITYSGATR